jgi:hypothetical protein
MIELSGRFLFLFYLVMIETRAWYILVVQFTTELHYIPRQGFLNNHHTNASRSNCEHIFLKKMGKSEKLKNKKSQQKWEMKKKH